MALQRKTAHRSKTISGDLLAAAYSIDQSIRVSQYLVLLNMKAQGSRLGNLCTRGGERGIPAKYCGRWMMRLGSSLRFTFPSELGRLGRHAQSGVRYSDGSILRAERTRAAVLSALT